MITNHLLENHYLLEVGLSPDDYLMFLIILKIIRLATIPLEVIESRYEFDP